MQIKNEFITRYAIENLINFILFRFTLQVRQTQNRPKDNNETKCN